MRLDEPSDAACMLRGSRVRRALRRRRVRALDFGVPRRLGLVGDRSRARAGRRSASRRRRADLRGRAVPVSTRGRRHRLGPGGVRSAAGQRRVPGSQARDRDVRRRGPHPHLVGPGTRARVCRPGGLAPLPARRDARQRERAARRRHRCCRLRAADGHGGHRPRGPDRRIREAVGRARDGVAARLPAVRVRGGGPCGSGRHAGWPGDDRYLRIRRLGPSPRSRGAVRRAVRGQPRGHGDRALAVAARRGAHGRRSRRRPRPARTRGGTGLGGHLGHPARALRRHLRRPADRARPAGHWVARAMDGPCHRGRVTHRDHAPAPVLRRGDPRRRTGPQR